MEGVRSTPSFWRRRCRHLVWHRRCLLRDCARPRSADGLSRLEWPTPSTTATRRGRLLIIGGRYFMIGALQGALPVRRCCDGALVRRRAAAGVGLVVHVPVPQHAQPPAMTSTLLVEPPKFSGFSDPQSPKVFLEQLGNFSLVSGMNEAKRPHNMLPDALEGSAKLWRWFVGVSLRETNSQKPSAWSSLLLTANVT
ncbi:hypothetical protein MRX96_005759 [Rhipicephalus microplus]